MAFYDARRICFALGASGALGIEFRAKVGPSLGFGAQGLRPERKTLLVA